MENFINGVFKFVAAVFVFLFMLSAGAALVFFNAEKRLFDEKLYAQALEKQNFYERLPAIAAEAMTAPPQEGESFSAVRSLLVIVPAEHWEAALRALLPTEVSKPMTEEALASIFAYLDGESETASVSLAGFKARMNDPSSAQAFVDILRVQPACTFDQLAEMTFSAIAGNPKLIFCNPSDDALGLIQPLIQSGLASAATGVPDSVTLIEPGDANSQSALQSLRAARSLMQFSPIVPALLLVLIAIFAARSWKDLLAWCGLPLLLGGIFGAVAAAPIAPIFEQGFAERILPRLPASMPDSLREILRGVVGAVMEGVVTPIMIHSAIMAGVGIILLIAAGVLSRKQTAQERR
jgi:hypothetical protein